ncbi:hypothetical protein PMAYCL1PPCAC_26240, partial [Pristionchus mayeri]
FVMSLNRFVIIFLPKFSQIYERSSLIWVLALIGAAGYFIGKCERQIYQDGTFMDKCHRSLGRNNTFPEYTSNPALYNAAQISNPGLYDVAQAIRTVLIRCYDILPLISFVLYTLITGLILKHRRKVSSSKRRSDLRTLSQGLVVLIVYLVSRVRRGRKDSYLSAFSTLPEGVVQLILFLYLGLDVITVTVIPLSICLTVAELRETQREMVVKWRMRAR